MDAQDGPEKDIAQKKEDIAQTEEVIETEPSAVTPPEDAGVVRQSRKREREVSLEPGTPQAASIDVETGHSEIKDRRTPAKKNRVSAQLDATEEEEESEGALGLVPDVSGSPRHESKIRQISQGVEDITWQNMAKQPTPEPEAEQPSAEDQHEPMDAESTQPDEKEAVQVPPLMRGENPPQVLDGDGAEEHAGEADPAEVPPSAQAEDPIPVQGNIASTPPKTSSPPYPPSSPVREPASLSRRGSDESMDQEKGLKRKLADRTVSDRKVPEDLLAGKDVAKHVGAVKRPRDDPDADENPRETKRPTPPPDEEKEAESAPTTASTSQAASQEPSKPSTPNLSQEQPKLSGFMAYASTSSPFAAVKGPNLFTTSKASPWAIPSSSTAPKPISTPVSSSSGASSPPRESSLKRTGFEAFASSASPFASAAKRPKSPTPSSASSSVFGHRSRSPARHHSPARAAVSAFSAYATGGAHAFATPSHRRSGSGSPALGDGAEAGPSTSTAANPLAGGESESPEESENEKGVSFGERLRASKDEDEDDASEKKLNLTEQEVETGEEDEETVYQVRGKLFSLSSQNQWKERGTGQLKLNVRRDDGTGARLLMRKEAVYTVLLNATLFKGMKCFLAQDPRYIRFSVFEEGATTHYNLRVSNAKIAAELLEEINAHIP